MQVSRPNMTENPLRKTWRKHFEMHAFARTGYLRNKRLRMPWGLAPGQVCQKS